MKPAQNRTQRMVDGVVRVQFRWYCQQDQVLPKPRIRKRAVESYVAKATERLVSRNQVFGRAWARAGHILHLRDVLNALDRRQAGP